MVGCAPQGQGPRQLTKTPAGRESIQCVHLCFLTNLRLGEVKRQGGKRIPQKKRQQTPRSKAGGNQAAPLCRTLPQRGCLSIARVSRPSQGGQRSNRPGGPPRAPGAVGLPHGEAVGPAVGGGVRGRPAGHRGQRRGDMSHAGSVRGMCKTLKSEVKNHKLNFKVSYLIFILLFKFSFITLI